LRNRLADRGAAVIASGPSAANFRDSTGSRGWRMRRMRRIVNSSAATTTPTAAVAITTCIVVRAIVAEVVADCTGGQSDSFCFGHS
jgi:hypothetical protein